MIKSHNFETIFLGQALSPGVNNLSFPVPAGAVEGGSYARFRCTTFGAVPYIGPAPDGEVEDHLVVIGDLPDMGGLQVAQLLRYLWYLAGETANVNLIVASSPADYSKRECYAAGATDWLRKPLQADRLISVLEYHLVI